MALTVTTNIHTDAATTFVVKSSPGSKVSWLSIDSPDMTSHTGVFMNDAALRRLRDAIDANLGEASDEARDNAGSDLYVAVEAVIGETCARKPSTRATSDDADEAFSEGEAAEGWRLAQMLTTALKAYDAAIEAKTEAA